MLAFQTRLSTKTKNQIKRPFPKLEKKTHRTEVTKVFFFHLTSMESSARAHFVPFCSKEAVLKFADLIKSFVSFKQTSRVKSSISYSFLDL